MRLFPVGPSDYCDCVSLALWLRNLAYQVKTKNNILSSSWSACEWSYRQDQMIKEGDLMMISESDVFISTDRVLQPLDNAGYKAWIYWVCNLSSKNILTTSSACLFANHLKLGFFLKFTLCEENWTKVEPALYGGETFAMSFTTLRKVEREHKIKKALFITAFNKNVICTEFFCSNFPPDLVTTMVATPV